MKPLLWALCSLSPPGATAQANELILPGDAALRSDIQLLADAGLIATPVMAWPLSGAAILAAMGPEPPPAHLRGYLSDAWYRVWRQVQHSSRVELAISAVSDAVTMRRFADTPRTSGVGVVMQSGTGPFSARFSGVVADRTDRTDSRLDGSYVGFRWGSWLVSAGLVPRWWGPGHDSSLILSTNARPIPSLALDTIDALRFESRLLRWIGPVHWSIFAGKLEGHRYVPDAKLLGARLSLRPTAKLEIGLSRTAQWGGAGRPESLDSLFKLLIGRDNNGDAGITLANEPGNQLGGIDLRWSSAIGEMPYALYTQWIGEDEAGGLPSRHIAMAGVETWGPWRGGQRRFYVEAANTAIEFYKSQARYNLAYEHFIYRDGYRYRGRGIGHAMDNDSVMLSAGMIAQTGAIAWQTTLRKIDVNRDHSSGLAPHTVAPLGEKRWEFLLGVKQPAVKGQLNWGLNFEYVDPAQAPTRFDTLAHATWTRTW